METIDQIKNHFESEAHEFDELILKLIPFYQEMVSAVVLALPFPTDAIINVIDLGCGTGTLAQRILEKYPKARITCLDLAENMIQMARIKLTSHPNVTYVTGDIAHYEFDQPYEVIVSSLALHHLANESEQKSFYRKVYQAMAPDGVFYNADLVLGSNEHLQTIYLQKWQAYMEKSVSRMEIETKWLPNYRVEDRPVKLESLLSWLKETGFREIDVIWKYYNFAVYGGYK
jgi:tRNA (cmo5U34)-methyltransferase